MARTPSRMIPLGTNAPSFSLEDVRSSQSYSLPEHKGRIATVVMFICNHCPFVKHVSSQLVQLALDYQQKGFQFLAISSNDALQYPDDGPDQMRSVAHKLGYPFPYLYDVTQEVAKKYDAACTPDFFIFDKDLLLVYRGQLDDSRPGNSIPVTGRDIRKALDALIQNLPVSTDQRPSIGCNIKWKKPPD